MATLMSAVRKDNRVLFDKLLPDASSKHVDNSIAISVRDGHPEFFEDLFSHPKLTEKGLLHAFSCAVCNKERGILRTMLDSGRVPTETIMDYLFM